MKLATFTHDGSARIGVVSGDEIVDLENRVIEEPAETATENLT